MADFLFDIDVKQIAEDLGVESKKLQKQIQQSAKDLAAMTHAKVLELASSDLGSLSRMYKDNVDFTNPEEGMWVVTLKSPAMFIEEGMKGGFMDWLLNTNSPQSKSKTKMGKNGRYRVIPFVHSKNPSEQSPKAQALANEIKQFMRSKKIPWKKIETNPDGSPRIGKIHEFDLDHPRLKPQHKTGPLKKVSVYQVKNQVTGQVEKHVVTFRVISDKHKSEGLWYHPGMEAKKILDKAYDWAVDTWEKEILPEYFEEYKRNG